MHPRFVRTDSVPDLLSCQLIIRYRFMKAEYSNRTKVVARGAVPEWAPKLEMLKVFADPAGLAWFGRRGNKGKNSSWH
jgi:hypothetical protein